MGRSILENTVNQSCFRRTIGEIEEEKMKKKSVFFLG